MRPRIDSSHYRGFARRGMHLRAHDFSKSFGFLLHSAVWRKTTKNARTFDLLYGRIWNFMGVCVLIFLSLGCNSVMWYELNKKLWNILLLFPIPSHENRKPTWRSRVWWLAKSAWYDVTWKPPIGDNPSMRAVLGRWRSWRHQSTS